MRVNHEVPKFIFLNFLLKFTAFHLSSFGFKLSHSNNRWIIHTLTLIYYITKHLFTETEVVSGLQNTLFTSVSQY
jgi:hypothetical protein